MIIKVRGLGISIVLILIFLIISILLFLSFGIIIIIIPIFLAIGCLAWFYNLFKRKNKKDYIDARFKIR